MADTNTKYDIVVFGASGYTGRLVAEYLQGEYANTGLKWAMAGRSLDKLASVRTALGIPDSVDLVSVDSDDAASVGQMVSDCKVVITTVGPYQLYGEELIKQCAEQGTDYVDLSGEPNWMHETIAQHSAAAKASGARIVHSCGFDSIPFDLGVYCLQQHAITQTGKPIATVKGRVRAMNGTFSGGTIASMRATMASAQANPAIIKVLTNPFALTEGFTGPEQPTGAVPQYDEELNSWSAPFVMAAINTKNIHRSNFLLRHQYGEDFRYDEMLLTGDGEQGKAAAEYVAKDDSIGKSDLQPGDGPTQEERENGNYDAIFAGQNSEGELMISSVQGDRDPGYGSTSKMLAEAAICLLENPTLASGGLWTPAAAMGQALIDRLHAHAGLTFQIEKG
ncbi:saccharopine dehydrogenase NADP-binding domain-containing protein [Luminiphilus sp.]|nr:saccharopine dehydrogenase NADP-binding domain-containing protein [Luminiphilus sp.]MDA9666830.1 saccharopine dehydrogenase NADP-binding domain-containing protein [Luminiphilus sp.]